MNDDLHHADEQKIRQLAEIEITNIGSMIDRTLNQHTKDYKWLTGSLMLLNSGAIAGVMNTDAISIAGSKNPQYCIL